MKPNLALDKYKDNVFPGSLLLALNGGRLSSYIEQDTAPKKEVIPKPIKPKEQKYAHVFVTIHTASNLPKLDSNFLGGGLDPYVKVLIDGDEKTKTNVKKNTTNPKWNKKLTLTNIELHKQKMILQVYDHDDLSSDEFAAYTQPIKLNGKNMSRSIKLYISEEAKKEYKENKNLS
eukprot:503762_1